ncbi:hypothetical protein [Chryseobacterium herbae]|uniref:Uncharacterized protein n=1 Tax=Chryseobacterium herbae TaxID=2976476 RepID=A0ABT2IYU5_9FLAO|nr:hypothetical protein [Chryseobacterium sp. pc1-10]MCT2563972.1 hypothetical protein [Chryseobacterium sp. pc1-10]
MENLSQYSVIYSNKMGMGYIIPDPIDINSFINRIPVKIGNETIQPQAKTTLIGYFDISPAMYIGMLENEMIFYLGDTSDLFERKQYFIAIVKVSETRIFSMFSHNAGRDFNLVNNKWK